MNSPKALLSWRGRTFLETVVTAMRGGGCDRIVVVAGPSGDPTADRIAEAAAALGASVIRNPDPASEQLESLRLAVSDLDPGRDVLVVSPVDSPGFGEDVVAAILDALSSARPLAVPVYEGRRGHPLGLAGDALTELFSPGLVDGARGLIRRLESRLAEVQVKESGVLLDVDTPDEYERLLREGR